MSASRIPIQLLLMALALQSALSHGEQVMRFGDWQVHYVVVNTEFLQPDIAARYGIVRGRDRSMINISVLRGANAATATPTRVKLTGHATNLLGQRQALDFKEVREGEAVYYLAEIKHTNEEVLRFDVRVNPPDGSQQSLKFQQKLYWSAL